MFIKRACHNFKALVCDLIESPNIQNIKENAAFDLITTKQPEYFTAEMRVSLSLFKETWSF